MVLLKLWLSVAIMCLFRLCWVLCRFRFYDFCKWKHMFSLFGFPILFALSIKSIFAWRMLLKLCGLFWTYVLLVTFQDLSFVYYFFSLRIMPIVIAKTNSRTYNQGQIYTYNEWVIFLAWFDVLGIRPIAIPLIRTSMGPLHASVPTHAAYFF